MARNLCRTAYNTVVYEIHDFEIGIHDADGRTVADTPGIATPGANDYGIQRSIEFLGRHSLCEGDVVMLNYPYWSSAHTLDVLVFAPVVADDELLGFASCRVHLLDLGQKDVGYVLDSTDMYQEGIFFPSVKIYERGELREDIFNIIRFNSRMPERTIGDLQAQASAVHTGVVRVLDLARRFGADVIADAMRQIHEHGERLSRAAVAALPDGTWTATDFCDSDGIDLDEMLPLTVTVTIDGDRMIMDWRETDVVARGPVNLPLGGTIAACRLVFKALTTPDSPVCDGNFRNLEILTTPGTLLHATPPMPTFTLWTGFTAPEVITRALAQGLPHLVPACSGGDVCDVMVLGTDPETGEQWLEATNDAVGFGAHAGGDGEDGIMHPTEPGCRNNPVEVLETKGPMLIERYGYRIDSAGPGRHRGGVGVERVYRFLAPANAIVINYKTKTAPWGIDGGRDAAANRVVVFPDGPAPRDVGVSNTAFEPGEAIVNLTGGGGGWGDPFDRDEAAVAADVRLGFVSPAAAAAQYGVVTDGVTVDRDATAHLRAERKVVA
jgi:N-methylhydantoinase B